MQPGIGVADAVRLEWKQVGVARHPGEPGGILDDEGERRLVAPGPVEAEARHPDHDQVGAVAPQSLVGQAGLVEDPGRVSSRQPRRGGQQPAQQVHARLVTGGRGSGSTCWC